MEPSMCMGSLLYIYPVLGDETSLSGPNNKKNKKTRDNSIVH